MDQVRGLILANVEAFARNKYDIGCVTILQHSIDLTEGSKAHKEPLQRLNPAKQQAADEQVAALGVIESAHSPWASGIFMVKKKDESLDRTTCLDVTRAATRLKDLGSQQVSNL